MKSHRFVSSHSHDYDSDCATCGGKLRDSIHDPARITDIEEAAQAAAELPENWAEDNGWQYTRPGYVRPHPYVTESIRRGERGETVWK